LKFFHVNPKIIFKVISPSLDPIISLFHFHLKTFFQKTAIFRKWIFVCSHPKDSFFNNKNEFEQKKLLNTIYFDFPVCVYEVPTLPLLLGSISPTFYSKFLQMLIPKAQIDWRIFLFFAILGSAPIKTARKMLVKSTPDWFIRRKKNFLSSLWFRSDNWKEEKQIKEK